jgi:hypothetical protein
MTRREMYLDYLREEGFRPTFDDDGIYFKVEGKTFILFADGGDEELFRLGAFGIFPLRLPDDLPHAYRAASDISARFKVAKAFVIGDEKVVATTELFFGQPEQFKPVFERCISILQGAVREFAQRMHEYRNETPVAQA